MAISYQRSDPIKPPNTRMLRGYLLFYALALSITAVIIAIPGVLTAALLMSFGLLLPLAFVPALTVYLTALLPAVFARNAGASRMASALTAIGCVAAVALLPGLVAQLAVQIDAKPILRQDVAGHLAFKPRAIEHERPARFYGGQDDPLRTAPCDALCQTLLLSRTMDAVRVSAIDTFGRTPVTKAAVNYSYEERATCPKAFADAEAALPETKAASTHGRCIVANAAGDWKAGVKLVTAETRNGNGWPPRWPILSRGRDVTRHEVLVAEEGRWRLVSRATELRARVLMIPLLFGYPESYGLTLKPGWERTPVTINETDAADALAATLGFRPTMPDQGPAEPITETIDRVLSAQGEEKLGPELMDVINRHLDAARKNPALRAEDLALAHRLIRHPRVTNHFRVYLLLERHPAAAAGMIEHILNRLEAPIGDENWHNHNHLAWILARAPIESLRRHAQRILDIAGRSVDVPLSPLLRIAGRLNVDPTQLLTAGMQAQHHTMRQAAAIGICSADEPWASRLAPEADAIVDVYRKKKSVSGYEDIVAVLKIMNRAGRESEVAAFLDSKDEQDVRQIRYALSRKPVADLTYCEN